ncbi:type II CRISPR RNA-guided endonuclease Cas9 [Microbulbifer sp. JMSA004]|uniref:type II CRISPR RNA-guided endonuclease Cas9 n=1 Tax=Microbulbifer sp. JMSA004 TaxID=3243370 RepID=UPI0040392231
MYQLGLDLGTASIGAAAISLKQEGLPQDLIWWECQLFSEPLENDKGQLKPKKAERRGARLQRRQIERRAGRLKHLATLKPLLGLTHTPVPTANAQVHYLRAKAAREEIDLESFHQVLMHISKRRGYGGTLKVQSKQAEAGEVKSGNLRLTEELEALSQSLQVARATIGEYLHLRKQFNLPTRLKVASEGIYHCPQYPAFRSALNLDSAGESLPNMYTLREDLVFEFNQIWATQQQYHPALRNPEIRQSFFDVLFFQRPLKSPEDKVAKCPLSEFHLRAPRAQMSAQQFRIEKQLLDLRWGRGKHASPLTREQRSIIRALMNESREVSFSRIEKSLEKAGQNPPAGKSLNMDRAQLGGREYLSGNSTLAAWRSLKLDDCWEKLQTITQIQVINFLADLGSPEQLDSDDWHQRFVGKNNQPKSFSAEFRSFIDKLRTQPKFGRLSAMGFDSGRASYSVKALTQLTEWIRQQEEENPGAKLSEHSAIQACFLDTAKPPIASDHPLLGAPPVTGNDTVDIALRQLRTVINRAITRLNGKPEQIVIELAREMKKGPKARNEQERQNNLFAKARKAAAEKIAEHGITVSSTRILCYQLWEEQGHQCPYCEKSIGLEQALSGAETNLEHILPRSLTNVGRRRSELVLSHRACNDEKGNRTPYQAFGRDPERWRLIESRAEALQKRSKQKYYRKSALLVMRDYEQEVLTDESIAGFAERQLHETSWLAKVAAQWLSELGCQVYVSRGQLTADLRHRWKLNTVIPQARLDSGLPIADMDGKEISREEFERHRQYWEGHTATQESWTPRQPDKRIDHRHHLVDAIVIALTSRSLLQKYANAWRRAQEASGRKPRLELTPAIANIRELTLAAVKACWPKHKTDRYPDACLFEDTAYGLSEKQTHEGESETWLVKRKPISAMAPKGKTAEKVIETINKEVAGETIKAHLIKVFQQRIAAGQTPQEALDSPIEFQGNILRKVRCYHQHSRNGRRIEHRSRSGLHHKYLIPEGYAYLEAKRLESGGISSPTLVRAVEALAIKEQPVPEDCIRVYKGDTWREKQSGRHFLVREFNVDKNILLILTPATETKPVKQLNKHWGKKKKSANKFFVEFEPV